MTLLRYARLPSPLGPLLVTCDAVGLCGLYMENGRTPLAPQPDWAHAPDAFTEVAAQLDEYFAGRRRQFQVRLSLFGSAFQRRVWAALQAIEYGATTSYGELARQIGSPRGMRAVGLANGSNPISIIVPCHRVIGADGSLTGYGGGLANKQFLLDLEAGRRPLFGP